MYVCINLVPRPICGRGKTAWYRLFAHVRNLRVNVPSVMSFTTFDDEDCSEGEVAHILFTTLAAAFCSVAVGGD